ncbi:MAG: NAD(+) diphosphatase [Spirochaetales bacterium]|uniref:NAD(+) diphosphatase n=1 Tax=Candidatus Thalassospirochaeta sargassi TaxID=3119039 RepID=A0AAJ1ID58_9SPIO|nr:NAD(+) diphosphatase [Spirochaetales bacterium]
MIKFKPAYKSVRAQQPNDLTFIFAGADILVNEDRVPSVEDTVSLLTEAGLDPESDGMFFGSIEELNCYAYDLPETFVSEEWEISAGDSFGVNQFVLLRRWVGEFEKNINTAAGYASHLLHWHKHSRFCGRCGTENNWYEKERAKRCPSCGNMQYPKISPAIIIMIQKDNKILLGHNRRFPEGRYSLLAGFMEIGETIEETAVREVREEVGIEIGNLRYISSQSWPFPDSLMLGLRADYVSGEITPDGIEIVHADWYSPETFPSIPGHGTIARKIIDEYTKTYKS